jgi:hypothetical protein
MSDTIIHLTPEMFTTMERPLAECGALSARTFRYPSGVCALRVANELGQLVLLPFQGQQIWSAQFGGRELAMRSMFSQPRPTQAYLETYGAFLVHCGATAMGVPTAYDSHPLHGELPNAPYDRAWLAIGEDARGPYLAVSGEYEHIVAFNHHYIARPEVRLYAGATRFPISMTIHNLKRSPMELMYLAHVNFRPVDNGRLVYSAHCTPEHVRVRKSIPSHVHPPAGYAEFLAELSEHPERHNVLLPGMAFDPEVVFFIDYLAGADGWAHSMQIHPDGSADAIAHRPAELNHGVRWISRTADQDCLGIILPATAEPEGYLAEKAKGNIRTLDAGRSVRFEMEAGYVSAVEVPQFEAAIRAILEA